MSNTPNKNHNAEQPAITTHQEFRMVLKVAGYSQNELARAIGRSRSYVNNVANGISPLTLRVIEQLRYFLGEQLFDLAVTRARQVVIEERQRQIERERAWAIEMEYRANLAKEQEEQRRQAAIEALREQLECGAPPPEEQKPIDPDATDATDVAGG